LAAGPGRLTRSFGLDGSANGHPLQEEPVLIYSRRPDDLVNPVCGPRIGLKRATHLPWRFVDPSSESLSRPAPDIADSYGSP
jgi:DNA-3-methyladenine glycosylase